MSKKIYAAYVMTAATVIVGAGLAGMMSSHVTAAEPKAVDSPVDERITGGAPAKVLQDNDVLKATLVSFPKGHVRKGGDKRQLDQVLIYIDKAKYSNLPTPGTKVTAETAAASEAGQISYLDKGSVVGSLRVEEPYRALYVEIKRPAPVKK